MTIPQFYSKLYTEKKDSKPCGRTTNWVASFRYVCMYV